MIEINRLRCSLALYGFEAILQGMPQVARQGEILTLNGGSSSLKFAIFDVSRPGQHSTRGQFDRLGRDGATFRVESDLDSDDREIGRLDHRDATDYLLEWLDKKGELKAVVAVGHRIVHGGPRFVEPAIVDPAMLEELRRISPFAPEHLPTELEIVAACQRRLNGVPQIACFDTAFHRSMPAAARMLPIPRRYFEQGVERYGFHGLSYTYLMSALELGAGRDAAHGRLILAHLGNGVSLAAVKEGKSIDTTMGFTPAAGVPMGTRSGDLDPGLVQYLALAEGLDAASFDRLVNHESGLLGISGTSGDVRDLLHRETSDARAAEALALFCHCIRKAIGGLATALGGLDMLVFTGGIGEHSSEMRSRICEGIGFLGVDIDPASNTADAAVISTLSARVQVRVVATDEEAVIAQATAALLNKEAYE